MNEDDFEDDVVDQFDDLPIDLSELGDAYFND
jgi:hypothetical protein